MKNLAVVGHIPHTSTFIPRDVRPSFLISDDELRNEMLLLTDWYVDELFSWLGRRSCVFGVSRLVVDPERFPDDEQEVMASRGMGVVYRKTSDGRDLRALSEADHASLLERFYYPYAEMVTSAVEGCLNDYGTCLVLDCHSFASRPLPFEIDQEPDRPDICIGTDGFHTPSALSQGLETFFRSFGWRVSTNKPYSGTYVPLRFYKKDKKVKSVMIEIRRGLYMNESTGQKINSFENIMKNLSNLQAIVAKE